MLGDNIDENEIEKVLISYIKASKGYIRYIYFYSYSIDNLDQYIEKLEKIVINKLIPSDQVSKDATYFKLETNEYKKFETKFPFLCRTNKQSTNPFFCIDADFKENKVYKPIEIKEYPNQIEDKLYLGDIHQAYDKNVLST